MFRSQLNIWGDWLAGFEGARERAADRVPRLALFGHRLGQVLS